MIDARKVWMQASAAVREGRPMGPLFPGLVHRAPSLFDRRCLMCRSSPATQIEHSGGAMMVPRGIDSVGSAGRVLHLRSGCHCGGGYCVGLERG